jgi:Na+/melibiose symporter-like transporter
MQPCLMVVAVSRAVLLVANRVLWTQAGGVAAVQAAISLMWLVYRLYILKLCKQFGIEPEFTFSIFIVEDLIAIAFEPFFGNFSDQLKHQIGTTIPLIVGGVFFAASLFIAIPAIALLSPPADLTRGFLVGILLLWAIAMAAFRAPVLALLGSYASNLALPKLPV